MPSPPARHPRVQPAGNNFAWNKDARPFYPRAERKQKKREMEKAFGVCTVNITAWSSLKAEIEADAEWLKPVHILLVQEHKLRANELRGVLLYLAGRGWSAHFGTCLKGKGGGRSAGVGIMWRSWITRASEPAELVRGRLVAVAFQVKIGPFERVWFASLYATTDSEAARSAQLRAFGRWHGEQSWPVVLGGDFNMDKVDTAAWSPAECAIVSTGPQDFTCVGPDHVSTIDYFMVSTCTSAYVGQISTQTSGIATHKPVKMVFKMLAHDPMVTTVQAGTRTAAGPVFGPHLEELTDTDWQHAYDRADGLAA